MSFPQVFPQACSTYHIWFQSLLFFSTGTLKTPCGKLGKSVENSLNLWKTFWGQKSFPQAQGVFHIFSTGFSTGWTLLNSFLVKDFPEFSFFSTGPTTTTRDLYIKCIYSKYSSKHWQAWVIQKNFKSQKNSVSTQKLHIRIAAF